LEGGEGVELGVLEEPAQEIITSLTTDDIDRVLYCLELALQETTGADSRDVYWTASYQMS
jgi:hypothetical protein